MINGPVLASSTLPTTKKLNAIRATLAPLLVSGMILLAGCSSGQSTEHDPGFGGLGDPATMDLLESESEQMAVMLGIENAPYVAALRLIKPEEYPHAQIECLGSQGWQATLSDDGEGVAYPEVGDAAQAGNLSLAIYTCAARYPLSPVYTQEATASQLAYLYEYYVDELMPCLRSLQYTVVDVPSEQVFIESDGMWSPYASLALAPAEYRIANESCPSAPDSDDLAAQR